MLIRLYGSMPEGVTSILIMNAPTLIIDNFTIPRMPGDVKVRNICAWL